MRRLFVLLLTLVLQTKGEKIRMASDTITLSSGNAIPKIGLGTWQAEPGAVGNAVTTAVKEGYKLIDCAAVYGNEAEIGASLSKIFSSGSVSRSDLFITSKLWNSEHAPQYVLPAVEKTLKDLQLEYLDLYMIHWPQAFQHVDGATASFPRNEDGSIKYDLETSLVDTWKAMEALYEKGLVKSLGLSNFNVAQITEIMSIAKIKPSVLQVEIHPYFQQSELAAFCKQQGIVLMAYSPLATNDGVSKDGARIVENKALQAVGEKKGGFSAAQIAIAWSVNSGFVCIPKSVTPSRIQQNLEAGSIVLDEAEMNAVKALDENKRFGWAGPLVTRNGRQEPRDLVHPLYPFKDECAA